MDFLKTGFNLTAENDSSLDDDSIKMLTALMTLFVEDAMRTAIIYTNTRNRKEITAHDVRKSLMYQAQTFFNQDESLEDRYVKMIQSMDEESEDEESGEEESGDEDSGDEDSGEESSSQLMCDETIIDAELARCMDETENSWHTWNPTDPVLCLLKRSIDKIDPDACEEPEVSNECVQRC